MWYVVQTMTGKEQELVDLIHKILPDDVYRECFFLKRQLLKRLGGKWVELTETLFPAYVFLDLDSPNEAFYQLKRIPEFTKILGDNCGEFVPLEEKEQKFLELLCLDVLPETVRESFKIEHRNYLVRNTKISLDEYGKIRTMKGPLQYFRNNIVRMNLRKRYAIIEITMRGETQTVLLGIRLEKD